MNLARTLSRAFGVRLTLRKRPLPKLPGNSPGFLDDRNWTDDDWSRLLDTLLTEGIVSRREVVALVLGNLNPPQVGTSVASKKTFQSNYQPRQTWQAVKAWFYLQAGSCVDCDTMLDLQADHVVSKQLLGDAADTLPNMVLRCRRHNVARRPSHLNANKTFLSTESALMMILFTNRPGTYQEYLAQCREYGLTMSSIRVQEAWAMAIWLSKQGKYDIKDISG